ncbi:hypothetical protein GSI_02247 [Ganoderma sinense ZZ0214-1]|uniref:ATP-dependent DNA helicase n=1 Tax=Ganoderma sinense ZZ0214-1 TaxID=1077348 RepID=A0A2G8SP39_9APHY|nr:hypothetical protein GSI_02247 [Ganoderma sinense ZZ0214-1]
MHVLYECYDSRDDYAAQRRVKGDKGSGYTPMDSVADVDDDELPGLDEVPYDHTEDTLTMILDEGALGKRTAKSRVEMEKITLLLGAQRHGVPACLSGNTSGQSSSFVPSGSTTHWKELIQAQKKRVLDERRAGAERGDEGAGEHIGGQQEPNAGSVFVVTYAMLESLRNRQTDIAGGPQDSNLLLLHGVIEQFTLNEEQLNAFFLAAKHLHHHEPDPLRMIIAGMAGTDRNESHRFVVLGPTGSSAALIGGSTYHSILGFTLSSDTGPFASNSHDKVRSRLELVDMLFIDEFSMISCLSVFHIHKQLASAFSTSLEAFGGKSIVLAGDPAQLPPPGRSPALYSSKVEYAARHMY